MKAILNWSLKRLIKVAEKELAKDDITPERRRELEGALVELRSALK